MIMKAHACTRCKFEAIMFRSRGLINLYVSFLSLPFVLFNKANPKPTLLSLSDFINYSCYQIDAKMQKEKGDRICLVGKNSCNRWCS